MLDTVAHLGAMTKQISLKLPADVLDRLRDVAERERRPCATLVRYAIEDWVRLGCPDLRQHQTQREGVAA